MKKHLIRILSLILAVVTAAALLAGCDEKKPGGQKPLESAGHQSTGESAVSGAVSKEEQPPKTEQTLKLASVITGTCDKLDYPWYTTGGIVFAAMYRTLLEAENNLTDVRPDLAARYAVSDDGLVYTFELKDGQKWSDGEPVTGKDVEFSIKTVLKAASANAIFTNAFKMIKGAKDLIEGKTAELAGVNVDGGTVTITLDKPYGAFLSVTAQFAILPYHAIRDIDPLKLNNDDFWANPVVCGAFKMGEMSPGNYFVLVPNENYGGTPWKITKIINYYVPDMITAAQAGKLDYFVTNATDVVSELSKLDYMDVYPVDALFYRYLVCCMKGVDGFENPVMQDKRVREAILYAIDRETLVKRMFPNMAAKVVNSGLPGDYPESNGKVYEYNPEKAKALLKEANYDFTHNFRILYYYKDQTSIDFVEAIAFYLRETGMKVEVIHSQASNKDLFEVRDYDIGYKGLFAFNISEWYGEYLSDHAKFKNIFGGDTRFDELATAIAAETDSAKRSSLLKELEAMEQDNLYKLPLYTVGNDIFVNKAHVRLPEGTVFGNPRYDYAMNIENWEIVG